MRKKQLTILTVILLLSIIMTGCDVASFSLISKGKKSANGYERSTSYWSGTTIRSITIKEGESTNIQFETEIEKGNVSFTVKNSDGDEIYTLSKNETGTSSDVFNAESAGQYTIIDKGSKFSGSYKILWGDFDEENMEKTK